CCHGGSAASRSVSSQLGREFRNRNDGWSMKRFVDPRLNPQPTAARPPLRLTEEESALETLHGLCREGRLYAVEEWIREGKPLQLTEPGVAPRRRPVSALTLALERQDHALT